MAIGFAEAVIYLIVFWICYLMGYLAGLMLASDASAQRNDAVADFLTQNNTQEVD